MSTLSLEEEYVPASPLVGFNAPANERVSSPSPAANGQPELESSEEEFTPASPPPIPASNVVRRKLTGFVGFANLPNQWHRRSVRKGFQFAMMLVGESGLGKSTMVNTLLNNETYGPKEYNLGAEKTEKTVATKSMTAVVHEDGVKLELTVVDTPGFGEFVNNEECWKPILDRIEKGYDSYLEAENNANRRDIRDDRIHACIFFIDPTGHALKPIEIEFMRRLHHRVNLIPVIAKADTMTEQEIINFKARVLADIAFHKIRIFQAPRYALDDEETVQENQEIMNKIPFAIVGSNNFVQNSAGKSVRGRQYPWGVIEVDNEDHCDFSKLRQMLIRTHMEELKDHTRSVLYENYRSEKLTQMGVSQDQSVFKEVSPQAKMEEERILHEAKLAKMENEMKMVFQQKVQEKEAKLKQSEEELYARHKEMKDNLEKQRLELEDKKSKWERGIPMQEEKGRRGKFTLGRN
ncbi:Cell division control protein 3 [Taphrina deformans PYCC 5710]|uniref:Cell division control protein 3 n=1 Tax=Taphrina deformans (strain PYCC 5710 / ATCC 11124 / CBS 356.35 / IMI 108563 / JCM 9778 / NBRC 8474) TaxID=1097556 RepID=R4X7F9_TAPDE|nr:Cell division control protein 3 [Taphrina deformans PYCC 5710]|eukprot:CCG81294.1 Cell division control protein 3 [Taphrina deformans PYCC 5710]